MIYTGYYSTIKEYTDAGLKLLSISRTKPGFVKDCVDVPPLFPDEKILRGYKKGDIDEMEYTSLYLDQLDKIGIRNILKAIHTFGDDVILLCWEAPGKFCHRHILADYINRNSKLNIEEYYG